MCTYESVCLWPVKESLLSYRSSPDPLEKKAWRTERGKGENLKGNNARSHSCRPGRYHAQFKFSTLLDAMYEEPQLPFRSMPRGELRSVYLQC